MRHDDFELEYSALYQAAYRAGFRLLGERVQAEDVAQEALIRAYARWRTVRPYAQAFVVRVATNLALDALRRRKRFADELTDYAAPGSASAGATTEFRIDLARALAALPKRQRDVVALRYLADMSEADVAAALGCAPGTVKAHASRAMAALRSSVSLMTVVEE